MRVSEAIPSELGKTGKTSRSSLHQGKPHTLAEYQPLQLKTLANRTEGKTDLVVKIRLCMSKKLSIFESHVCHMFVVRNGTFLWPRAAWKKWDGKSGYDNTSTMSFSTSATEPD